MEKCTYFKVMVLQKLQLLKTIVYISGIGNLLGGWARSVKSFYQAGQMDTELIRTCISQNLVSLC